MRVKGYYTPEQIELLESDIPIQSLAVLPIFAGRTFQSLDNKRRALRNKELTTSKRVPLYQFIKIEEATPERVKQWK